MADLTPSQHIDRYIQEHADWRGKMLARLRKLIRESAPELTEEWKWGSPIFAHKGNVLSTGAFKDHVKLNFFKGASLKDPKKLFNAGLEAKGSRGIDLYEGEEIDESDLKDLIREAVEFNSSAKKK